MTNQTPKPFAERIEEKRQEHLAERPKGNYVSHGYSFDRGVRAALSLLAEPQAGRPPRVWVSTKRFRLVSGGEAPDAAFVSFQDSNEHLSMSEHQASRAADMLELENLQARIAQLADSSFVNAATEAAEYWRDEAVKELTAEREARARDAAEIEKLRACLAEVGAKWSEALNQRNAEREARKADAAEIEKARARISQLEDASFLNGDIVRLSTEILFANERMSKWKAAIEALTKKLESEREKNAKLTAALDNCLPECYCYRAVGQCERCRILGGTVKKI